MKKSLFLKAIFPLVLFVALLLPMKTFATSSHYDVFLSLVDQTTGKNVSNPNTQYIFYAEDGSVIDTTGTDNAAYFDSTTYSSYYYTGRDKVAKVAVYLDGWIFETHEYEVTFEDSGTSGTVECRITIPVTPDTSIDKLNIYAGLARETTPIDKSGYEMKIRKTGETEFLQTAVTDSTGIAAFENLELGAYDVYYPNMDKWYYIFPSSTGDRYAYFTPSSYTHYLKVQCSLSSFYKYFTFELTDKDGNVIEPSSSNGTNWRLTSGANCYLTTTSVPDGYTGEVFDHYRIVPYTNMETVTFELEQDIVVSGMTHDLYNVSYYSSEGQCYVSFKEESEQTAAEAMASFTEGISELRYYYVLKGAPSIITSSYITVPVSDVVISDVTTSSDVTESLSNFNGSQIKIRKTGKDYCNFNVTITANGESTTVPVTAYMSSNKSEWISAVIDESSLKSTKSKSNGSATVSWTAPNDYVSYYEVIRYNSAGTKEKEFQATSTSFTDTGLKTGQFYTYDIAAVYDFEGEYIHSNFVPREVSFVTLAKVTNAKASNNKMNSVKLTWKKVANVDGYEIKRLNTAGTVLKTKTTTSLSLTDTSLKSATKYNYSIRPYVVENGKKLYGTAVTVKTSTLCKAPSAPTLKAGSKSMTVSFKKVTGAAGYEIRYSTSKGFTTSTTKKTTVTGTKSTLSKTIKSLKKGKTYYVKVRAYVKTASGAKVYTGYSSVKTVKVK